MSTQFNFPANPTVGDQFTLPNGVITQWNGSEWLSVSDASANVTYPLPITLGGTAATTPSQARFNLGLNLATGEFVVQKDGTVAQPGIVFASEPGLGWYRGGANNISIAAAGQLMGSFASAGLNTTLTVLARGAGGQGSLQLINAIGGSTSYNASILTTTPAGYTLLTNGVAGSATTKPMLLQAQWLEFTPAVATQNLNELYLRANNVTNAQNSIYGGIAGTVYWRMDIGDTTAPTATATGKNFRLLRFDNAGTFMDVPFQIDRGTGNFALNGAGTVAGSLQVGAGFSAAGTISTPGQVAGQSSVAAGGGGHIGHFYTCKSDGTIVGDISGGVTSGNPAALDISSNGPINFYNVSGLQLLLDPAQTTFIQAAVKFPNITGVAAGSNVYIEQGDANRIYKITSSLRYKKDVEPMARTEMIYDLEPIWFRMIEDHLDPRNSYYGFGAEDVADIDPRLAHWVDGQPEGVQYDRIIVPVVAEMKKLRDRIIQLESQSCN